MASMFGLKPHFGVRGMTTGLPQRHRKSRMQITSHKLPQRFPPILPRRVSRLPKGMGPGSLKSRKRASPKVQCISQASEPGAVQRVAHKLNTVSHSQEVLDSLMSRISATSKDLQALLSMTVLFVITRVLVRGALQKRSAQFTAALSHWRENLDVLMSRIGVSAKDLQAFLPMTALFFTMAFINTIVNNLSMSLVITAPMGSAGVISFLTVYAALPMTFGATLLYTYASHFISPKKLFTITVGIFAAFNLLFALCVFPNHEALHLPGVADGMAKILPSGLHGAVGMVRNWTFSAFYCLSEMWGDLGISLLFWGFANDITTSKQAPLFYPIMGIGANIAQILGGCVLKAFSAGGAAAFSTHLQSLLLKLVGCMVVVMALHQFIATKAEKRQKLSLLQKSNKVTPKEVPSLSMKTKALPSIKNTRETENKITGKKKFQPRLSGGIHQRQLHLLPVRPPSYVVFKNRNGLQTTVRPEDLGSMPLINVRDEPTTPPSPKSHPVKREQKQSVKSNEEKPAKPSFMDSIKSLGDNPIVKSLGMMTIAQAVSVTLMEFVWKSHCKVAYPTAAAFSAFMGDVATCVGVLTCAMMVLSPILFNRIGWKGVASLTPALMTFGGCAFFALSSAFHILGQLGMTQVAQQLLPLTVFGGAFIFILSRGTKFSLFKPSEEIIFINMEAEKRQKAKATVDVLGANLGKSGGSLLQQALLVLFGGHLTFITPVMFAVYMTMMQGWNRAVNFLSDFQDKNKTNNPETEEPLQSEFLPEEKIPQPREARMGLQQNNVQPTLKSHPLRYPEDKGLKSKPVDFDEAATTEEAERVPALV